MNEPIKRKAGRPKRDADAPDMRESILLAAVNILITKGMAQLTIRNVCEKAGISVGTYYHYFKNKDDLLSFFVKDAVYREVKLTAPLSQVGTRIFELWSYQFRLYQSLGVEFTRSYYNTDNRAISAVLMRKDGAYEDGTLINRCQQELENAQKEGYLLRDADPHTLAGDLCDIVKGCVFEWCLCKGDMPLEATIRRIISGYLAPVILHGTAAAG